MRCPAGSCVWVIPGAHRLDEDSEEGRGTGWPPGQPHGHPRAGSWQLALGASVPTGTGEWERLSHAGSGVQAPPSDQGCLDFDRAPPPPSAAAEKLTRWKREVESQTPTPPRPVLRVLGAGEQKALQRRLRVRAAPLAALPAQRS